MFDLDLDPMTLILKLDLDMVKMYHHAKMKFLCQLVQKLQLKQINTQTQINRQTERLYENITSTAYAGGKKIL